MSMTTRYRMRQLVAAEEDTMSPLRGHKEPAPDDSGLEDPKKAKAKDAVPVVDPSVVESSPVVEPVEEKPAE